MTRTRWTFTWMLPATAAAIVCGLTFSAQAAPQTPQKDQPAKRVGDVYPLGVDPVTGADLTDVEQPVDLLYHGRDLHFADQQNADAFQADPDKYLPHVDQLIIEQQKPLYPLDTCVVSGEKLGGDMGEPIDRVIGNRLVRFCCPMCVGTFEKDPQKYLKKLDAAVIAKQLADYPLSTCVVTGDKLGSMGKPIDYVSGDRLVRFCCAPCIAGFEKNPAHYRAMIDAAAKHEQTPPAEAK